MGAAIVQKARRSSEMDETIVNMSVNVCVASVDGKYTAFRAPVGVTQQPHIVDPSDPALTGTHVLRLPAAPGAADVWLIGTAHVSALSVEQVLAVLSAVKPDVVVLELCSDRLPIIQATQVATKVPTMQQLLEQRAKGVDIGTLAMSYMNAYVADTCGVQLGGEFKAAADYATRTKTICTLGDRNVRITLKRVLGALSPWQKVKFVFMLLAPCAVPWTGKDMLTDEIEKLRTGEDTIEAAIEELQKTFPAIGAPLLHERNEYLTYSLQIVASSCAGGRVVGVVGQAHLTGIADYWKQGMITDERISQITKLPGAMPASWKWQKRGLIAGSVLGSCGWMYLAYRYPGPTLCFSCVPTLPVVMYAGGAPAPEKTTQRIGLAVVCASVFGLGCWSVQRLLK